MPRNQSGTYSLPSGNPVAAGTLIDATWANNTLNDIANELTDSLSRSGEGGMLAPFRIADGLQATPGLAFTNEPSTGLYRAGSNDAWLVVGGTQVTQLTTNGMAGRFAAGAVTTPSVTRLGDLNTGIYFPGADEFAIATGGVARMTFDSAGAVAIPGTLSVTGDVTVDTNTLFVDAANNRVGVGTVTPAVKLDVAGGVSIGSADNLTWGGAYGATTPAISGSAGFLAFYPNGSTSGEQMRLTATGLGIGTSSPTTAGAGYTAVGVNGSNGSNLALNGGGTNIGLIYAATGNSNLYVTNQTASGNLIFGAGSGNERARIDSSGNLGLGVTPSAWQSTRRVVQVGANGGALWGINSGSGTCFLSNNTYYDGTTYKYINTANATYYAQASDGKHEWHTAASGTAGNNATFTQAMTLDASGNLGVGTTSPNVRLSLGSGTGTKFATFDSGGVLSGFGVDLSGGSYELSLFSGYNGGNGTITFGGYNTATSTFTERARITSGGDLLVGTTTAAGVGGYTFLSQPGGVAAINNNDAAATGYVFSSYRRSSTEIGSITQNGTTAVLFNTTSDRRLKDNIVPAPSASDVIDAIEIVSHDWKSAPDEHVTYGVIAQDLALVAPQAVLQGDDGDEIEKTWGVDYSKLVPMLVKEIQSLRARVAALEAGV